MIFISGQTIKDIKKGIFGFEKEVKAPPFLYCLDSNHSTVFVCVGWGWDFMLLL